MSTMTPAQELRMAAERVREVADKSTPAPWRDRGHLVAAEGTSVAQTFWTDSTHIALWDPAVALLVAEVLDNVGKGLEYPSGRGPNAVEEQRQSNIYRHELALARVINGGNA